MNTSSGHMGKVSQDCLSPCLNLFLRFTRFLASGSRKSFFVVFSLFLFYGGINPAGQNRWKREDYAGTRRKGVNHAAGLLLQMLYKCSGVSFRRKKKNSVKNRQELAKNSPPED